MARHPKAEKDQVQSETRKKLLDAAAVEFADKGFQGANINHISQSAGFAKGTIYNYFPSKRELMLALIDEIAGEHASFIMTRVVVETDPVLRLKRFFTAGFQFARQFPTLTQIVISAVFGHDPEFKAQIFEGYDEFFTFIMEDIINYGIKREVFKPIELDPGTAFLMSLYLGNISILGSEEYDENWIEGNLDFVLQGWAQIPKSHGIYRDDPLDDQDLPFGFRLEKCY